MAVYVSNITIPSGEDFDQTFVLENSIGNSSFDLSNYTAYAQLKKHPSSLSIAAEFNVTFINEIEGELVLSLASSITSNLKPGRYTYDILINDGSKTKRVVEGSALVTGGVTKIT